MKRAKQPRRFLFTLEEMAFDPARFPAWKWRRVRLSIHARFAIVERNVRVA